MYNVYLVLHFVLMLVWVVAAGISDFRFMVGYPKAGRQEKITLLKSIQKLSNKTELPASFFIPLLGILMIIDRPFWLKVGIIHGKIALAILAVGLYHASRGVMKKMLSGLPASSADLLRGAGWEVGDPGLEHSDLSGLAKKYLIFRAVTLVLLVVVVGLILGYKGTFGTVYLLRSWLK